jgi:hypothetical protein
MATNRLETIFSTDKQTALMSAARLYRQYSAKYPSDPVSENEFALLVSELRPAVEDESEHVSALGNEKGDAAVTERTPSQAPVRDIRNGDGNADVRRETRHDPRDRNAGPPVQSKYLELLSAWKEITKNSTGTKNSKRELNVLGWGIGEQM